WNPLRDIVRSGDTVVLKPNFVREFRETHEGHADCVMTHGSVIRAVLDYVYIGLNGRGRIVIADAPHNDADFEAIRKIAGLDEIQALYRREAGFEVEVYDLRPERANKIDGVIVGHAGAGRRSVQRQRVQEPARTHDRGAVQAAVSVSRTGAVRGGGSDQAHGQANLR